MPTGSGDGSGGANARESGCPGKRLLRKAIAQASDRSGERRSGGTCVRSRESPQRNFTRFLRKSGIRLCPDDEETAPVLARNWKFSEISGIV